MSVKLREALAKDLLYVALQPIVDLHAKRVFANEALLRSKTPELKNPLTTIEMAIANDFMGTLGRALRQMAVVSCAQTPLFLNINPAEFDEGWLVRPDDPIFCHDHMVYMEITESVPLSHFRLCHSVLKEIRSKGVSLAIDDLGAGYSNFKYISDLGPEIVKLDRELIAGVVKDTRLYKLLRGIVRMCDDLGAKVVAEGIETREELAAVIDAGAHFGQGYLLARPALPVPEVDWSVFEGLTTTPLQSSDKESKPKVKVPTGRVAP